MSTVRSAMLRMTAASSPSLLVATGCLAALLVFIWMRDPTFEGDSLALVAGARQAATCAEDGTFVRCGASVVHFPIVQYLIAVPGVWLGWSDETILRALVVVNAAALVGAGVVLVHTGRRLAGHSGALVMAAVALSSPLLVYGASTFREPLTAACVVFMLAAVLLRTRLWLVALTAFVASVNQETLPPFLLLMGWAAARDFDSDKLLPKLRPSLAIGVGISAGVVVNALFNVFRFGSVRNTALLVDDFQVPRLSWRAALLVSLWVSPNGGILWFWFVPVCVIVAVLMRGLVLLARRPREWWRWGPRVAPAAVASAHTVGLASWWSPWGWYAWGPRLSYPLVAGLALLALHVDRQWLDHGVRRLSGSPARAALLVGLVLVIALPQIGATYDDDPYRQQFFASGDAQCPQARGNPVSETATVEYYYECQLLHRAWGRRPLVLAERAGAAFNPLMLPVLALGAWVLAVPASAIVRERGDRRRHSRVAG